jgi:hypothetical protein
LSLVEMIVRPDTGRGRITIRATADGLKPATLKLDRLGVETRHPAPSAGVGVPARTKAQPLLSLVAGARSGDGCSTAWRR